MNAPPHPPAQRPAAVALREITRVFARIGLLSFGGPAAQIALLHREVVERRAWLDEAEFLRALSFCMLLPGPEAMQLATYAGWKLRGMTGGLIAGLLFVLPGAALILVLAALYALWGGMPVVTALFFGIKACVVVIVVEALIRVARRALHSAVERAIAVAAFASLALAGLPFPLLILLAALAGALWLPPPRIKPPPGAQAPPAEAQGTSGGASWPSSGPAALPILPRPVSPQTAPQGQSGARGVKAVGRPSAQAAKTAADGLVRVLDQPSRPPPLPSGDSPVPSVPSVPPGAAPGPDPAVAAASTLPSPAEPGASGRAADPAPAGATCDRPAGGGRPGPSLPGGRGPLSALRGAASGQLGKAARLLAAGSLVWLLPLALTALTGPRFLTEIGLFFGKLAVVSFGGAYAVLGYMTQTLVQDHGWIGTAQMMDALGLAETTPGPLILVTEFVAYLAGHTAGGAALGLSAALLTLWMTFVPSFVWIFACAPFVEALAERPRLAAALRGVTAAVVGVIAALALWFALQLFFARLAKLELGPLRLTWPDWSSLDLWAAAIAALAGVALHGGRLPLPLVLAGAAVLSLALWHAGLLAAG